MSFLSMQMADHHMAHVVGRRAKPHDRRGGIAFGKQPGP